MNNAKSLKKIAYTIAIYSVSTEILAAILCSAFVTKIFTIDLLSIHWSGVIVGGLIFIVADIFQYGVFLQNEYDTTL
ncbi:hypothetical protein SDC9_201427 [bioreactor metagenome]|uniref:Uncharacterized protein n=2 Tax=root TaxID=1 RepID=A0A645IQY0_9ZZZZ